MVNSPVREWYLQRADRIDGPFTLDELRRMLDSGAIHSGELVRQGELGAWTAVRSVVGTFEERRSAPLSEAARERPAPLGLDAPTAEWGLAALIGSSALVIATQLTVQAGHPVREPGGSRTLGFLLTFAMQFVLLLGHGGSVAAGVLGLLGYVKHRQHVALNSAGAVLALVALLLWLITMIALVRALD